MSRLRQAAEAIVETYLAGRFGEVPAVVKGRMATLRAALAEPDPVQEAVDDGEAATESWLKKIGGVRDDRVTASLTFHREDAMSIGFWLVDDGWKAMLIHHEHAASCIVRGLKTRGEIRRLLLSLKARDFLAKHAREGT